MQKFPSAVFTVYQLPGGFIYSARASGKFSEQGEPQYPFEYQESYRCQHEGKEFFCIVGEGSYFEF